MIAALIGSIGLSMIFHKRIKWVNTKYSCEDYVPKTWNIDDKTNVFLGAISEKNRNDKTTTNTLTLVGNINFAGVEINYI